jgi:hypothetical protein
VQLWALPKGDDTGRVEVGVANLVSDTTRYRLTVTQDNEVLSDGVIDIAEGDSAIFVVEASSGATSASQVEAVLSSVVFTSGPLRRVYVTPSRNGGAAVEREEEAERP